MNRHVMSLRRVLTLSVSALRPSRSVPAYALLATLAFSPPTGSAQTSSTPAMPHTAPQWEQVEISLTANGRYANPYMDVDVWAVFRHEDGTELLRPAFWAGGATWKVRFASTKPSGRWTWKTHSAPADAGLAGLGGEFTATPTQSKNRFHRRGFWHIPAGSRNLYHADGTPALLVGDTAWALPWRATHDACLTYARDRQAKGFNAVLLMSIQPDREAKGPRSRTELDGFDVGFEDLPSGHITQLNPAYFDYLDGLIRILIDHELVPVHQPVFHGYGWKGLNAAGTGISAAEYSRYCRYLVARYGALPAIWLVSGDGDGLSPGVDPAGREIERWDCYAQPAGNHYAPHALPWAHQDKAWLDFQWCQTGHNGEHVTQRVATMWEKTPAKAVANGEATYEHIGQMGRAAGWWQGHEAWLNLTAGSTMGVVYGAGSLWQWRLNKAEAHQEWCMAKDADWRDALAFEGSRYVGLLTRLFDGLPFGEMQPDFIRTYGRRGLLVPGKLFVVYLENGGDLGLTAMNDYPQTYRVYDPKTGNEVGRGELKERGDRSVKIEAGHPRVVIFRSE